MAASDYVPIFFKNRLHLAGRPQMSTRPRQDFRPRPADRTGLGRALLFAVLARPRPQKGVAFTISEPPSFPLHC